MRHPSAEAVELFFSALRGCGRLVSLQLSFSASNPKSRVSPSRWTRDILGQRLDRKRNPLCHFKHRLAYDARYEQQSGVQLCTSGKVLIFSVTSLDLLLPKKK